MAIREYQRLTRTRNRHLFSFAISSRTSLWLGGDHLLCIDTNGYTETYKRFYFRDIQAFTLTSSKRRLIWNLVLGFLTVPCLAGLVTTLLSTPGADAGAIVGWSVPTFVFGVPLLINNLLGPACVCYLRTAVQVEELASLSRWRKARNVLARLRPLIAAAQGELAPEEIPARLRELAAAPAPGDAAPETAPKFVVDDPNVPPRIIS
jgi:hypothetical protein